jgi:hypothetical protein
VTDAVITVNLLQRLRVRDYPGGELAGLNVLQIINELTGGAGLRIDKLTKTKPFSFRPWRGGTPTSRS